MKVIYIRTTKQEHEEISQHAARLDANMSSWIRSLIESELGFPVERVGRAHRQLAPASNVIFVRVPEPLHIAILSAAAVQGLAPSHWALNLVRRAIKSRS